MIGTGMAMLIGGLAAAGGQAAGAKIGANANRDAAAQSTAAANHAADLQAEANRQAIAFEREQAQNAFLNSEAARRGNYDQWAAREARLGSIGAALGYGSRPVPGYVPGVDPHYTGGPTAGAALAVPVGSGRTPAAAAAAGSPMAVRPDDPRVAAILDKALAGQAPTSASLDVAIKALNDAGIQASRARHGVNGSLASDDKIDFGNGAGIDLISNVGGPNAAFIRNIYGPGYDAPQAAPRSVGSALGGTALPFLRLPVTPGLSLPAPYTGSVGRYLM